MKLEVLMVRNVSSKVRVLLLVSCLVAAGIIVATTSAQTGTPSTGAPPATSKQGIGQLFSLIWTHRDPIFYTIVALSIAGITFIIQGFISNRSAVFMPDDTTNRIREMIQARQFRELIEFTETDPSFVSRAVNPALKRAPSWAAMKEAMETSIAEQTAEQFRKIEYLNIIGNLGPLLGLLGTVLGMIYAFQAVAESGGQANMSVLTAGIAVALAHTFMGLFLAVPCLAAFGVLRTIVDRLTTRGALVAEELLMMMKPPETGRGTTTGASPARPVAAPQPATNVAAAAAAPPSAAMPMSPPPPARGTRATPPSPQVGT